MACVYIFTGSESGVNLSDGDMGIMRWPCRFSGW